MTPEAKVKKSVKDILKTYGVYYIMPLGQSFGQTGIPDFICCFEGKFFGIETKAGKNTCTPRQLLQHKSIRRAGGAVLVINENNLNDIKTFLESCYV